MIEVGALLRMWGNHSIWLALDEIVDIFHNPLDVFHEGPGAVVRDKCAWSKSRLNSLIERIGLLSLSWAHDTPFQREGSDGPAAYGSRPSQLRQAETYQAPIDPSGKTTSEAAITCLESSVRRHLAVSPDARYRHSLCPPPKYDRSRNSSGSIDI